MALEYREKSVRLANPWVDSSGSSRTHLRIPKNLYLIGTMNSTDRSLAMIDYALRRRFYFYPLRPVVGDSAPVLERWLASSDLAESERVRLLRYFVSINQRISDHLTADFQVGHSYFMNEQVATSSGMQQVWDFALKPLLQEYFHSVRGGSDIIDEFDPARFDAPAEPSETDFDDDQPEL
jgi:5-methylcytosine-specific restriction protein B